MGCKAYPSAIPPVCPWTLSLTVTKGGISSAFGKGLKAIVVWHLSPSPKLATRKLAPGVPALVSCIYHLIPKKQRNQKRRLALMFLIETIERRDTLTTVKSCRDD